MSQCPLCHAPVKDDFGLIECAGCGAQLIVHMDGRVEYQGAKESSVVREERPEEKSKTGIGNFEPVEAIRELEIDLDAPVSAEPEAEPTQMRTIVRPSHAKDLVPPEKTGAGYRMPEDDLYDAARDYTSEIPQALSSDAEPSDEPPELPAPGDGEAPKEFLGDPFAEDEPVAEDYVAPADFSSEEEVQAEEFSPEPAMAEENQDLFPDFEKQDSSSGGAVYNSSDSPASPDMSDVARFGNSDISGGREGPLRYNLFIEGIDTVDVREAFREALTDRKLMWDTDQILRSVRNGRVNIPNIAPTKAYILITRLRGMPVQVRWEQYAISQT